jgi:hypothetical protein
VANEIDFSNYWVAIIGCVMSVWTNGHHFVEDYDLDAT